MSLISAEPKLIPVLVMDATVSETQVLFANKIKDTRLVLGTLFDGTVKTIKNDLGFAMDLTNYCGYGMLESFKDLKYGILDNRFHGTTEDGYDVEMTYNGILRAEVGADTVLQGTKESAKDVYLSNTPKFQIPGEVPEHLQWVLKENFIGRGTFTVKDGVRYGQYHIYVIR